MAKSTTIISVPVAITDAPRSYMPHPRLSCDSRALVHWQLAVGVRFEGSPHGCCWETCCIFASCGLVGEIQIHLTAKFYIFVALPTSTKPWRFLAMTTTRLPALEVQDVVIAVPSSFCDVQRQAVLDAAQIAGLSVLRIMTPGAIGASNGCGSKLSRSGKPRVLVHVSTYQGSILEFRFFEPQPKGCELKPG